MQTSTLELPCGGTPSTSEIQACIQNTETVSSCVRNTCTPDLGNPFTNMEPLVDIYIINNTNATFSYSEDRLRFLGQSSNTSGTWIVPPAIAIQPGTIGFARSAASLGSTPTAGLTFSTELSYDITNSARGGTFSISVCETSETVEMQGVTIVEMGALQSCSNDLAVTLSQTPSSITSAFQLGQSSIAIEINGMIPKNFCLNDENCSLGETCESNRCVSIVSSNQAEIIIVVSVTVSVLVVIFLIFLVFLKNREK